MATMAIYPCKECGGKHWSYGKMNKCSEAEPPQEPSLKDKGVTKIGNLWLQELLVLWQRFQLHYYDSTTPKLDKNNPGQLIEPTLSEFMSWLVTQLEPKELL